MTAPDFSAEADRIADWLSEYAARVRARPPAPVPVRSRRGYWYSDDEDSDEQDAAPDKLVWLLEHAYSEAGLSFSALKNLDEAVAQALSEAADRSGCAFHAAILRIEQIGDAIIEWDRYGNEVATEMDEANIHSDSRLLGNWVAPDGSRPEFGEIPIDECELIPCEHLGEMEPDEEDYEPPTGNAGATLERTYRVGALVLWPWDRGVDVLAQGGIGSVVGHLARERERSAGDPGASEALLLLANRLIEIWPEPDPYGGNHSKASSSMIRELLHLGAAEPLERFLSGSVLPYYVGTINAALCEAAVSLGPEKSGTLLGPVIGRAFGSKPNEVIGLVSGLDAATRGEDSANWNDAFGDFARILLASLGTPSGSGVAGRSAETGDGMLSVASVAGLFQMLDRLDLGKSASLYSEALVGNKGRVDAYRDLADALDTLEGTAPRLIQARQVLWCHAVERLVARSGQPPRKPENWIIRAKILQKTKVGWSDYGSARSWSESECLRQLQAFCDDPNATKKEFPARQEVRMNLQSLIRRENLDIECHTVSRGSPHRLVCVKNRASYLRRLEQYAGDVACMERLRKLAAALRVEPEELAVLEDAIHLSERRAQG